MGIIINKNNLEGGTKEELIDYLFSVCNNLKKKKVTNSKIWLIVRKTMFAIFALMCILAIALSILSHNQMDKYVGLLEQNGYEIEMRESVYNNYVFYGIGHTQYKEELDEIVNILDEEMK